MLAEGLSRTIAGMSDSKPMKFTDAEIFRPQGGSLIHPDYSLLHFKATTGNNNIWGFEDDEVDELIQVYQDDLDPAARLEAMYRIDEIVHEEAFYIPFWDAPYTRLVHWDYVQFPEFYFPRKNQTNNITDWMVYWIDPERRARLEQAMASGEALPLDDELDKDYYGIRERFLP